MKKTFYFIISVIVLLGFNPIFAAETEEEVSTLTNQAQVQKAENLAEASQELSAEEVAKAQESVNTAQQEYETAAAALEADPENQELQDALSAAQENLDTATSSLAEAAGATTESINEMRASGMGWGEIAHELGIHPSVLGLGHTKKEMNTERVRNTKSFKTSTLGNTNKGEKGQGLKGKSTNSSNGKSSAGNNGKGQGSSNAGGNGNGNGGGKNK